MTDENREKTEALSPDTERFVERLKAAYEPRPMDAVRRAALDARLRERIERPRGPVWLAPAVATAAIALLAVWGLQPGVLEAPGTAPEVARADLPTADGWEAQLYLYEGPLESDSTDEETYLPPEYAAIDDLFFDG